MNTFLERFYNNSVTICTLVLGCLLLLSPWRLLCLPLAGVFLLIFLWASRSKCGKYIVRWIDVHPIKMLAGILLIAMLLRVLLVVLIPSLPTMQYVDYEVLWQQALTFANVQFVANKSWTTVFYYGVIAKLFGDNLLVAYAGTCIIHGCIIVVGYLLFNRWVGKFAGLMYAFLFGSAPIFVYYTHYITTKHCYILFILLTLYFVTRAYDAIKTSTRVVMTILGALSCWLTIWSRAEGIVLLVAVVVLFITVYALKKIPFQYWFCIISIFMICSFGLGVFAICLNKQIDARSVTKEFYFSEDWRLAYLSYDGTATIFCSNDNLWPRLFGSNLASKGEFDGNLRRETIAEWKALYGNTNEKTVSTYIKEKTLCNWVSMTPCEVVYLVWCKFKKDFLSLRGGALSFDNKVLSFGYNMMNEGIVSVVILCIILGVFFQKSRVHFCFILVLIFSIGTILTLLLTEASQRYGFVVLNVLLPGYVASVVDTLLRPLLPDDRDV